MTNNPNDTYKKDLDRLKDILRDYLLLFDPFRFNDETLWKKVSKREFSTAHNIHCIIVRFGAPYEVEAKYDYPAHRRIPIFYAGKTGSKSLKDFSFPVIFNNKEYYNTILYPRNRPSWDYNEVLRGKGVECRLIDHSFFIIRSRDGVNKFGKKKSIWVMVALEDNLEIDCKIIREYTLIAQIWAFNAILSHPTDFGFSSDISKFEKFLNKVLETKRNKYKEKEDLFLPRKEEEEEEDWGFQDDGAYERDLQDELDYIRQNGGDWIDD